MDAVPITKKLIAFGSKKIYLPRFTIALVRARRLSPYHARFLVPLDFSKYDLRDYLYHAYDVKCFNIRSFVRQMPVRDVRERPRSWFRAPSEKYMTVKMEQPFVWPEIPDLEAWGQRQRKAEIHTAMDMSRTPASPEARDAARRMREQVADLLHGRGLMRRVDEEEGEEGQEEGTRGKNKGKGKGSLPAEADAKGQYKRSLKKGDVVRRSRIEDWEEQRISSRLGDDKHGDTLIKV